MKVNEFVQKYLNQKAPTLEETIRLSGLDENGAKHWLLRLDLRKARRDFEGQENRLVQSAKSELTDYCYRVIKENYQSDSGYFTRVDHEISLLAEMSNHPQGPKYLEAFYLAYCLRISAPQEYFGDGWCNGDCLIAYLLRLSPINPLTCGIAFEYFEQMVRHGSFRLRIKIRREFLEGRGCTMANFLGFDSEKDASKIIDAENQLRRLAVLWIEPRDVTTTFGQVATAQAESLNPNFLRDIDLDDNEVVTKILADRKANSKNLEKDMFFQHGGPIKTFKDLLKANCNPTVLESEPPHGYFDKNPSYTLMNIPFPMTSEGLFNLLYERSDDPVYAYEMAVEINRDSWWASHCPELKKEEREFYGTPHWLDPLPFTFERTYDQYVKTYLELSKNKKAGD